MPSLFDLPLPIREEIYRCALVMDRVFIRPFISMEYVTDPNRTEKHGIPTLTLLRASKQVYQEAMPIYLSENTFSVVQVDILVAARAEYPRVFENLKMIRNLEIVFDCRDYIYMAEYLGGVLPRVSTEVAVEDESESKEKTICSLQEMHAHLNVPGLRQPYSSDTEDDEDEDDEDSIWYEYHNRHIENMKEYLWGRTMTFVRQAFKLTNLYVDLHHCTCVNGCCRLATEVMDWGSIHVWLHGVPKQIHFRGTSVQEKEAISAIIDRQHFHRALNLGQIYDQHEVRDDREAAARYDEIFKNVYERLVEENEELRASS
ncbi:hypothetical protein ASPWEDRAFT_503465 [Aspergillus wentii DTO 134E9]|uniref:Uncharacterized protein n=1 Tax=Aspergillus wentii DTO 134E9 TaxID=1073089 RepID=A0A1L9RK45_ASPWE|nr:uncharacterized protein ASPWEDRAFT_503465 [Aspergillus wentii DTO 134E9]KAI9923592.1 hypothetical protein MW887_008514 [Aspergillus wentii]OJJ35271.1 hypothetical protein ASPWEDRAFT_503465 [Aspergillus wentii DTO 134E9]